MASETKWTPGPWKAVEHDERMGWWTVLRGSWDVSHNRASEPGVVADARYSAMTPEENSANAHLIAAAPALAESVMEDEHNIDLPYLLRLAAAKLPDPDSRLAADLRYRADKIAAALAQARGEDA